ncbi:MAG: hypothetical protein MMC33_003272 [Icmadophila ericetorum]|nr:hypothetical protein [Icmadophila ericetorum]
MPVTQSPYQLSVPAIPISMPNKSPYYTPPSLAQPLPYSRISVSPTSAGSSVNTSAVPSLTSGSCASNSCGEHENSSGGAGSVDLLEMMTTRLSVAIDPLPMDKSLVQQVQTSGAMNAKQRELMELQALAQQRLKSTRAKFTDGIKAAKEVKSDLAWAQKRVDLLGAKAARKYPTAYRASSQRYPSQVDY